MANSDQPRDADKSHIKLTPIRLQLIGVMATVVLVTSAAGNTFSALASGDDVSKAVAKHAEHPHAATALRDAIQDAELAKLNALLRRIEGVEARLDVVIQAGLSRSIRDRESMQTAARKVRRSAGVRAGSEADPLKMIDGL